MFTRRLVRRVLGLIVGFAAIVILFGSSSGDGAGQAEVEPARPPGKPIPMVASGQSLEIGLGLKDKQQNFWEGDVQISEGRVVAVEQARAGKMSEVNGRHFKVRAVKQKMVLQHPVLRVNLEAPPS